MHAGGARRHALPPMRIHLWQGGAQHQRRTRRSASWRRCTSQACWQRRRGPASAVVPLGSAYPQPTNKNEMQVHDGTAARSARQDRPSSSMPARYGSATRYVSPHFILPTILRVSGRSSRNGVRRRPTSVASIKCSSRSHRSLIRALGSRPSASDESPKYASASSWSSPTGHRFSCRASTFERTNSMNSRCRSSISPRIPRPATEPSK